MDHDHIATETSSQSPIQQGGKNTGWAIGVAVGAAVFFYIVYQLLFRFVIGAFASYDPSFATGFGALTLLVFGSNVLAFLSGAVVSRRIFPKSNTAGLFYGLATLLVTLTVLSVLLEMVRPDGTWLAAIITVVVNAITILAVRVFLLVDA
jgi:hypothetical protein